MSRTKVSDGEWVQPKRRGYQLECCDCGLVHLLNFRIEGDRVQFQAFRDEMKTAATRRERKRLTKHLSRAHS